MSLKTFSSVSAQQEFSFCRRKVVPTVKVRNKLSSFVVLSKDAMVHWYWLSFYLSDFCTLIHWEIIICSASMAAVASVSDESEKDLRKKMPRQDSNSGPPNLMDHDQCCWLQAIGALLFKINHQLSGKRVINTNLDKLTIYSRLVLKHP